MDEGYHSGGIGVDGGGGITNSQAYEWMRDITVEVNSE